MPSSVDTSDLRTLAERKFVEGQETSTKMMQQKHVWKHIQVNFARKTCCYLMVDNGKCMLSPSLISYLLDLFLSKLLLFFLHLPPGNSQMEEAAQHGSLSWNFPGLQCIWLHYGCILSPLPKRWAHVSIREFLIFSGCVLSWINIR